MLPAHQLQGELAILVPRYRHPRATITAGKGWASANAVARPHLQRCARAERRADPRKLLARPPQSQPRGLGRRLWQREGLWDCFKGRFV